MNTINIVRVTVAAPGRRIDLALPERSPVAELLPGLLRHAGEQLPDEGVASDGWVLRRAEGSRLDPTKTLHSHRVMDGEVLHLVPARTEWPELEYDDLVDAIASGSAQASSAWTPRQTRWAGLAFSALIAILGLVAVLRAGPSWLGPAAASLAVSIVLLTAAIIFARAAGDAGAGAVLAALALPFAFVGGGLLFAGDRQLLQLGAPHVLAASAALLLAGIAGLLGVVDRAALFTGAAMAGFLGIIGGWLAVDHSIGAAGSAAVVAGLGLILSPLFASLSIRMARMPMPVLPRTAGDLLRDDPKPPRSSVYAAVLRADALLTGMVWGLSLVSVVSFVLLVSTGGTAGVVLSCVMAAGLLLRARLYPVIRQRGALLAAGVSGVACLVVAWQMSGGAMLLLVNLPVLLIAAVVLALGALRYSTRTPSPYLPRYAELVEVLLILAVVPLACWVLGLYALLRGLAG